MQKTIHLILPILLFFSQFTFSMDEQGIAKEHAQGNELKLLIAAEKGTIETVQALLAAETNVNVTDAGGVTPLGLAAGRGDLAMVQLLLEHGALINGQEGTPFITPLQAASTKGQTKGHIDVMTFLLESGALVDLTDARLFTPLSLASMKGHTDAVALLLKHGAQVNAQAQNNKVTALMLATREGHVPTMQALLDAKAHIDLPDISGATALHAAVQGHKDAVVLLLQHDAAMNIQAPGVRNVTPLGLAVWAKQTEIAELLLKAKADANLADAKGITPLLHTVRENDIGMVQLLLQHGAGVDAQEASQGSTALKIAAEHEFIDVMKALLDAKAQLELPDRHGLTPLMLAAVEGKADAVALLLERGVQVNTKAQNNITALYLASKGGHVPTLQLLLDAGAEVNGSDAFGVTPLITACAMGHTDAAALLVEHRALVDAHAAGGGNVSALKYAAQLGHAAIVELLLNAGASVDIKDDAGITPLLAACNRGHLPVVELLLAHNADPELEDPKTKQNALGIATGNNFQEITELILKKKNLRVVNVSNSMGFTPLMMAAYHGNVGTLQTLLEQNADINAQMTAVDQTGKIRNATALHVAALQQHPRAVRALVIAGADVLLKDGNDDTPLHKTVHRGNQEIIDELLIEIPVYERASIRNCFAGVCALHLNRIQWINENGAEREFPLDLRKLLIRHLIACNAQGQMKRSVQLLRGKNKEDKTANSIALEAQHDKISEALDLDQPGSLKALDSRVRKNVHAIMLSPAEKKQGSLPKLE